MDSYLTLSRNQDKIDLQNHLSCFFIIFKHFRLSLFASVIGIISTKIEEAGGFILHFLLTTISIFLNIFQLISLVPDDARAVDLLTEFSFVCNKMKKSDRKIALSLGIHLAMSVLGKTWIHSNKFCSVQLRGVHLDRLV